VSDFKRRMLVSLYDQRPPWSVWIKILSGIEPTTSREPKKKCELSMATASKQTSETKQDGGTKTEA